MNAPTPLQQTLEHPSAVPRTLLMEATIDTLIEVSYIRASTMEIVKRPGVSRGDPDYYAGILDTWKNILSSFLTKQETDV